MKTTADTRRYLVTTADHRQESAVFNTWHSFGDALSDVLGREELNHGVAYDIVDTQSGRVLDCAEDCIA